MKQIFKLGVLVFSVLMACGGKPGTKMPSAPDEKLCTPAPALSPVKMAYEGKGVASRVVVATSDANFQSGQLVWANFDHFRDTNKSEWRKLSLSADAVVRSPVGSKNFYAINRRGVERAGSVEVISKDTALRVGNYSVGKNSNPQDILVARDQIAYVTRLNSNRLLKLNATDGSEPCGIDLTPWADSDGVPEMTKMFLVNDHELWVTLQRLDSTQTFYPPTDKSLVVVIDPQSDSVADNLTISLTGLNPVSDLKRGPRDFIYVADCGMVGEWDGGLEAIDPKTHRSRGFVVSEAQLKADLLDFEFITNRRVVLVVSTEGGMKLISYDLDLKLVDQTLVESSETGFSIAGIWKSPDDILWVANRSLKTPALDRFDFAFNKLPSLRVGLAPYSIAITD